MASPDNTYCNICETQSITKPAVKWCFECEEAICNECLKYHNSSKLTRGHMPIDIQGYKSLPPYILDIKQYCDEHGERFQNYCTSHDCPCCSRCIGSSHRKCDPLPSLHEVVQNVRTSTALTDIEERLENLKQFYINLCREKEMNISDLKAEKESILGQIKQIRNTLNGRLDELERDILQILSEMESTHRNRMEKICTDLKMNETEAFELLDSVSKMKEYASDLQIFLGRRKVEKEVVKKEEMLKEVSKNKTFNTEHIIFQENAVLSTLQTSLTSLGDISVVSRPTDVQLETKAKQAQIVATQTNNFDNLNLVFQRDIYIRHVFVGSQVIYGCALMENGSAVFSDSGGKRLLVKDAQSKEFTIALPTNPYDITCIDNKTLAVTTTMAKTIIIVGLESRTVTKTINDETCYGICSLNGKLMYSTLENGIKMLDLNTYGVHNLDIGNCTFDEYVACHNNKTYCTNREISSVTCYNPDNSIAWTFQISELEGPRGIAVDDKYNVYVGGQVSDNVVVISPDGQKYKVFSDLNIKRPRTICFDNRSKQILICGEMGPVKIFSIKN